MDIAFFIIIAGLSWAAHAALYAYYAPRFRDMIRTARFVLLHALEAAVVFGLGYGLAINVAGDSVALEELVFAGILTTLLDGLVFVFFRDYFRGLLSPVNIVLPVLAATGAVYGALLIFG